MLISPCLRPWSLKADPGEEKNKLKKVLMCPNLHLDHPRLAPFPCLSQNGLAGAGAGASPPGAMVVTPLEHGGTGQRGASCPGVSTTLMWVSPGTNPWGSKEEHLCLVKVHVFWAAFLLLCILQLQHLYSPSWFSLPPPPWLLLVNPLGQRSLSTPRGRRPIWEGSQESSTHPSRPLFP